MHPEKTLTHGYRPGIQKGVAALPQQKALAPWKSGKNPPLCADPSTRWVTLLPVATSYDMSIKHHSQLQTWDLTWPGIYPMPAFCTFGRFIGGWHQSSSFSCGNCLSSMYKIVYVTESTQVTAVVDRQAAPNSCFSLIMLIYCHEQKKLLSKSKKKIIGEHVPEIN